MAPDECAAPRVVFSESSPHYFHHPTGKRLTVGQPLPMGNEDPQSINCLMRKGKAPFPDLLAGSPGDVNILGDPQSPTPDGSSRSQLCSLEEVTLHAEDFGLLHKMKGPDGMSSMFLPTLKRGEHGPGGISLFKARDCQRRDIPEFQREVGAKDSRVLANEVLHLHTEAAVWS